MRVYLAGGMRSGWQERVRAEIPGHRYIDPCEHGLARETEYTLWDLLAIDSADVVFAYFEADNPSGFGLSLEVGYAKRGGKRIILVDEKSVTEEAMSRRLEMLYSCADVVVQSLDDGLHILQSLTKIR